MSDVNSASPVNPGAHVPGAHVNPSDDAIREILLASRTIAMVGASSNETRPSWRIMRVLLEAGFDVIPVNPRETEVHGRTAYATLHDVPVPIDIVDVFRPAQVTVPIADDAVAVGAKVFWLQLGIANEEAASHASAGGLVVVMDYCLGEVVHRLGITV